MTLQTISYASESLVDEIRTILQAAHELDQTISLEWIAKKLGLGIDAMAPVEFMSFVRVCDVALALEGWREVKRKGRSLGASR